MLHGQLPWIAPARQRNTSAYFGLMRRWMYFGRNLHQPHEGADSSLSRSIIVESLSSDDDGFIEILWSKIAATPSSSPIVVGVGWRLNESAGDGDFLVASCLSASLTPTTSVFLFIVESIFWAWASSHKSRESLFVHTQICIIATSLQLAQFNISILTHNMLIAMIIWIIYIFALIFYIFFPRWWINSNIKKLNCNSLHTRHTTRNRRLACWSRSLHHLFSSTQNSELVAKNTYANCTN